MKNNKKEALIMTRAELKAKAKAQLQGKIGKIFYVC